MSFFKKIFSSKKGNSQIEQQISFEGIATEEYFNNRYTEEQLDASVLDGALKMIESFFIDNNAERKVKSPINHPINLDQTMDEGLGFTMYCRAFDLEENHALMFLTFGFNDFMMKKFGFKLYRDAKPEFPLRTITLKYDNQGAKLSLYPIEYASKVLNFEASFEDLHKQIEEALKNMPTADDVMNAL